MLIDTVLRILKLKAETDRQATRTALEAVSIWLRGRGHASAANDITREIVHDEGDNP
jgi:hypothetical protein